MARKDTGRTFNIAVVGVSGTEKEKGQVGVGKSCLCNRFVRSLADDYYVEHISVLSQTDFSGRVVNNDHFLYWGDAYKVSDEGVEFHFQVIEQTEFIDDASFQPFKGGKMEPYVKRCANTKLTSAEKLMYICKNQLGIEKEYDQKVLPDGKTNIDGFLVTMDVSVVPSRPIERQVEFVAVILNNLMKTKKPIVVASTKHDEACDAFVREVEKLLSRKEYKNSIPLVETSAHENVNVDLAFLVLAQHIDRNKGRTRIIPYAEAARNLKETLDVATDAYQRLIRQQITDYRALWSSSSKRLAEHPEYQHYVELFGADQAVKLFRKHVKKLKDEHLALKIKKYMDTLPAILQEMFPDIPSLGSGDWETVKEKMQAHPDFSRYFLDTPADFSWVEADMLDLGDGRIPFDVLDTNEAEMVYLGHVNNLQRDQRKVENKIRFKQLLEETGYVTPGKSLSEVQVLFMGRDCFESLSEADCQQIYDQHQRELIDKSKQNLQELLLEHAHLFYQIRASALPGNYSWEDFKEVTASLEEDSRYKALDRLESERRLLLLQHVGFVHCPKREHCPAYPRCIDAFIEEVLVANPRRGTLNSNNPWSSSLTSNPLNLILLGARGLAQDLSSTLRQVCVDDEIEVDGHFFSLDYRVVNEQVSLPHYLLQSSDFVPQGCICVYSDASSLEYVRENLESTLLSNLEREDGLPFQGLPIVLLWVPDLSVPGPERANLRLEGLNLADSLLCPFIDSTETEQPNNAKLEDSDVHRAIKALVLSIEQKTGFPTLSHHSNYQVHHQSTLSHRTMDSAPPDIRVIMCMLCGDPYMLESVLGPFLSHPGCVQTGERSFSLSTFLGDAKRKVEVVVSSYHGAGAFRDELVHGFILVYSTKRKASLATLSAFSYNIPNLPIQIVAVTESGGASAFFNSEISHQLITAGNAAADRLQAHFMTITANAQNKTGFYAPFLKDVWDKKLEIEQAFRLEDSGTLHDSGEGTLERPFRPPPPPRNDSFRHARSNEEYDESDIYECLPTDGSPGEDLDDSLSPTCLDDRHISSSDDSGEMFSALNPEVPTTNLALARKSNGEHLVKPSQLKSGKLRHGFQVFPSPSTPPEPAPPDRDPIRDRASFFPRWPLKAAVASSLPTPAASKNNVETEEPNPELLCLQQQPKGWLDDFMFMRRTDPQAEAWNSSSTSYAYKAFTTGRRKHPAPHGSAHYGREAGTTTKQPGRLKMEEYNNVTDAIARMKLGSRASGAKEVPPPLPPPRQKVPPPVPTGPAPSAGVAPLAFPECEDFESGVDSSQLLEDSRGSYPSYAEGDYAYGATGSFDAGTGANSKMRSRQRREKGRPSYSDTDSDLSSMERRQRDSLRPRKASSHKRTRRKRGAIPVAPPRVPPPPLSAGSVGTPGKPYSFPVPGVPLPLAARCAGLDVSAPEKGQYRPLQDEDSSLDVSSPRDLGEGSPLFHTHGRSGVISEALRASQHRRDKSKSKEEDKHEKRRLKEEERQKKAANKERKRKSKSGGGSGAKGGGAQVLPTLEQLMEAEGRCVPLFIEKCITFIEEEGLDSEGIYRVPGNRAHVDMLFARFEEDPNCSIRELDIAVNAVATALKDYFSKRLPPVLSPDQMEELEDISLTSDRSCRLLALRSLLKKLSPVSFNLLKYIFQHFVRVAENCKANSMDSKNLAICWWPTLLPFEFTDMGRFECMRPHIEDTVQAMIDQFPFLFLGKEDVVMV